MKRKNDDYLVLAKVCMENMEERPHNFILSAVKVDLLRNNFAKQTLYNNFLYFKRYLKDGHVCKAMPKQFVTAIDSLIKVKNIELKRSIAPISKQLSYEEIIKRIDNEYNNLQEKYKEQLEEIAKNIQLLEQKRKDLDVYLTIKTNELSEKRNKLVREYFERV